MTVFIGEQAPDFTAECIMPDNAIEAKFNLKNYVNDHKCVLFFYPLNFTFVCPSEIIAFNNRLGEFLNRKTKIIAVSVDSKFSHLAWKNTPINAGGIGKVQFPIVSDINKDISRIYNVLAKGGMALRGTFIIDEDFILRHITINDFALGRNIEEAIRILDAIDYTREHGEVCPANWRQGASGMTETAQGVADYLTSNAQNL